MEVSVHASWIFRNFYLAVPPIFRSPVKNHLHFLMFVMRIKALINQKEKYVEGKNSPKKYDDRGIRTLAPKDQIYHVISHLILAP